MRLKDWMESRQKPGTIADVARRALASKANYSAVEKTFKKMYVLEALVQNGGSQQKTAVAIGVHPQTVNRVVRSLMLTAEDVQRLAERLRGAK
jgi:DNA-binding NtrC family response regulator